MEFPVLTNLSGRRILFLWIIVDADTVVCEINFRSHLFLFAQGLQRSRIMYDIYCGRLSNVAMDSDDISWGAVRHIVTLKII
jgi:hypothetical protein